MTASSERRQHCLQEMLSPSLSWETRHQIRARAAELGLDISAARDLSSDNPELVQRFAEEYAVLRSHKGVSIEDAQDIVRDVSYFGTMMVHLGLADGMVSGAVHTTAHTIKPSFEIIKTAPGVSVVSSVFLMCLADRVLVYGDCAVVPDPNPQELADIAASSADSARQFGIEPQNRHAVVLNRRVRIRGRC
jgi:phosphate acetyltransferase